MRECALPEFAYVRYNPDDFTNLESTMTTSSNAHWRFAPTGGGAEHGNSAGQHYFVNEAVTKTVREVLQNSVDHPVPGIDVVEVAFRLMTISPDDIGLQQRFPQV